MRMFFMGILQAYKGCDRLKIMNKASWGALGVLAIIVLGAFFLSKNNKVSVPTAPSATETPTTTSTDLVESPTIESMMVTYSDSGFLPASLTVKVGDTVTFKNQSGKSMWVASAPHPIHTAYPEFDAQKGVVRGEIYTFKFTKAGTWKYHNHFDPSDTGTIIAQ